MLSVLNSAGESGHLCMWNAGIDEDCGKVGVCAERWELVEWAYGYEGGLLLSGVIVARQRQWDKTSESRLEGNAVFDAARGIDEVCGSVDVSAEHRGLVRTTDQRRDLREVQFSTQREVGCVFRRKYVSKAVRKGSGFCKNAGVCKRLLVLLVETRKTLKRRDTSAAYVQGLLRFVKISMWDGNVAISGMLSISNSAGEKYRMCGSSAAVDDECGRLNVWAEYRAPSV
ncbi:hypothetical protein ENH_00033210 [Eimeria necatrix]|uniref:Uncharacterized protein n=1 Tax=Eimeria necatrix TaxID=51315 RepID=U6MTA4_9EIME|nr:hypothetical protein ENH_00033210 [Eimeria necatrix]CDJ67246.1 hypothetical protein ENH_00033210 [Eimeria necatrix]